MTADVTVGVWEKRASGWGLVRVLRTWQDLSYDPMFNRAGPWSMRLPFDASAFEVTKRHLLTFDGVGPRFTARVDNIGPKSDETGRPFIEVSGLDALALLGDARGYPDPASAPDAQLETKYRKSGAAENVLSALVRSNMVDRRGDDVVVPPSLGRGKNIVVNLFFKSLLEVVTRKCEYAGIGVRAGLVNTTSATRAEFRIEFYKPEDRSHRARLSHRVGTLRSWAQQDVAPTGTRAIVAASVLGTSRRVISVDLTSNTLTVDSDGGHALQTGSKIKLAGDVPEPLDASSDYYAIRVDGNTFRVAKSRAKAADRDAVDLTEAGLVVESVDVAANTLTISSGSLPKTGKVVRFLDSGNVPSPLSPGIDYYAIRVNRDTLKVANGAQGAADGNAIDLTGNGSGTIRLLEAGSIKVTEVNRILRQVIDHQAEEEWGRRVEVFIDARDEDSEDNTIIEERGTEALAEMTEQSSFELEATDAEGMRYGQHFHLGDLVTVELMTGVSKVDRLRAVRVTASASDGVRVGLTPGNPDAGSPLFGQAAIIRGLRRDVQALQREDS